MIRARLSMSLLERGQVKFIQVALDSRHSKCDSFNNQAPVQSFPTEENRAS